MFEVTNIQCMARFATERVNFEILEAFVLKVWLATALDLPLLKLAKVHYGKNDF